MLGGNLMAKDYNSPIEYMRCNHCGHNYHRLEVSMMFKRILKDLFLIAMYELGSISLLLITILESEDDIDTAPNDFALETDQYDLNRIKAEVSE